MRTCVLIGMVIGSLLTGSAYGATYKIELRDGVEHSVSSNIGMYFYHVFDSSTGTPTTLNVMNGASIGQSCEVNDSSIFNMSGGFIKTTIFSRGNSTLYFSGGDVGSWVSGYNSGWIGAYNSSTVYASGGNSGMLVGYDSSAVHVSAGKFDYVTVLTNATASVTGGDIGRLQVRNSSIATVYGSNFNYDFGVLTPSYGVLTGTWANGEQFSMDFQHYQGGGTIILAQVPEPNTLALLGLGVTALIRRRS